MTTTAAPMGEISAFRKREFRFTRSDFNRIRSILFESAGISLSERKGELVYGRLARRLRRLGLLSFKDYIRQVESSEEELKALISALTTNTTSFFREQHHFDFMKKELAPAWRTRSPDARKLRIWSAGCSSGQEPYTTAMVLDELLPLTEWDVKILATDIDEAVLEKGRTGVYPEASIAEVDPQRRRQYFQRGTGALAGQVRVRDPLRDLIRFRHLNLMEPWPFQNKFDIIFCRNVMIYFDVDTQRKVLERFTEYLRPDGFLFVGHSESLARHVPGLVSCGRTIYRVAS